MSKIVAGITISVDGYITGPDDGPGCGLGVAASGCTTGCSAGRGATNPPAGARRPARTRHTWTR